MKLVLFAGPTVDATTIRSFVAADVRGPASFGDVYRATKRGVDAVAIIDGYFDRVAAVWHKEILWAMSQGVHVFGAASMGALRAAELADFGMIGVGHVFRAFRSGELEDDDEVAVAHGSAELAFARSSEAMVNIRATLVAAVSASVISGDTQIELLKLAKGRFYPDRSFPALLTDATAANVDSQSLAALRDWLPSGRLDAKRADALELLAHLRHWAGESPSRMRVRYRFSDTDAWQQAKRLADCGEENETEDPINAEGLSEELKIIGGYQAARNAAALRGLAIEQAIAAGIQPDFDAKRAALERLRMQLGLLTDESVIRWRTEQCLDQAKAVAFFEDEARIAWAAPVFEEIARKHLADHLRAQGQFGQIHERVSAKNRSNSMPRSGSSELERLGLSEDELWCWYFAKKLNRPVPKNIDVAARSLGFRDVEELRAAAIRDVSYEREKS